MDFKPFDKIARLNRACTITEKIDGTNAQVFILQTDKAGYLESDYGVIIASRELEDKKEFMFAGSRTRWVTPESDNFGWASWVKANAEDLWKLGPGSHFGEWWGGKIQRGYGVEDKRFSLFNTARWNNENPNRPACCGVVPHLYTGQFTTNVISERIEFLRTYGSQAAPGFMQPEGIVVYLHASRTLFKVTLEGDDEPKEARERRLAYEAKTLALTQ